MVRPKMLLRKPIIRNPERQSPSKRDAFYGWSVGDGPSGTDNPSPPLLHMCFALLLLGRLNSTPWPPNSLVFLP